MKLGAAGISVLGHAFLVVRFGDNSVIHRAIPWFLRLTHSVLYSVLFDVKNMKKHILCFLYIAAENTSACELGAVRTGGKENKLSWAALCRITVVAVFVFRVSVV